MKKCNECKGRGFITYGGYFGSGKRGHPCPVCKGKRFIKNTYKDKGKVK